MTRRNMARIRRVRHTESVKKWKFESLRPPDNRLFAVTLSSFLLVLAFSFASQKTAVLKICVGVFDAGAAAMTALFRATTWVRHYTRKHHHHHHHHSSVSVCCADKDWRGGLQVVCELGVGLCTAHLGPQLNARVLECLPVCAVALVGCLFNSISHPSAIESEWRI